LAHLFGPFPRFGPIFYLFGPRQIFRIFATQVSFPQFSIDYIDHQWIDDNAFFNPSTWSAKLSKRMVVFFLTALDD